MRGSLRSGGKSATSGRDDDSFDDAFSDATASDAERRSGKACLAAFRSKRERRDSMAPLSSKKGASSAEKRFEYFAAAVVRPRESCGVSSTSEMKVPSGGMVPVNIWPCSKRRTSRTSRLRLCASMVTMPEMRDGRRREASSESGFSMGTVVCGLEDCGRPSDDAHISESRCGAPGFVGW